MKSEERLSEWRDVKQGIQITLKRERQHEGQETNRKERENRLTSSREIIKRTCVSGIVVLL